MIVMDESQTLVPVDIAVARELESEVSQQDLGGEVEAGGFYARVADRPLAYRLRTLYAKLELRQPKVLDLYDRFDLWLVPHRAMLMRRSGLAEPVSVGIDVRYADDGMTCYPVSLFPEFSYIRQGTIGGSLRFSAKMHENGELSAADTADWAGGLSLGGLQVSAAAKGEVSLALSADVVTPVISASGLGSTQCAWHFKKADRPLFGCDIETWAVLALPLGLNDFAYEMRFYFASRIAFFPTRRECEWQTVRCSVA